MDVSDVFTTEFETVEADDPVSTFEGSIRESPNRAVVVTDDGEYSGIVSERQLVGDTSTGTPPPGGSSGTWRRSDRPTTSGGSRPG